MADPLTGIGLLASSALGELMKSVIGIGILILVGWILYMAFFRPQPVHMNRIVFDKNWDATNDRLGLTSPKKLCLVPMSQSVEEIRKLPEYSIFHRPFGDITGVNMYPVSNSIPRLLAFAKNLDKKSYDDLIESNKEAIEQDRFWIAFSYKRVVSSKIPMFPTVKKTIIFIKPRQLININSANNEIYVRGVGLQPIGEYELIVDESSNITIEQFIKDQAQIISREVELSTWDLLAELMKKGMGLDTAMRKDLIKEGMNIAQSPTSNQEAQI